MDWEELAITELHGRFEAILRCIEKIVYPGLCGLSPEHPSSWSVLGNGLAYLTGGVDKFGSPIIYLPHNQNLVNCTKSDIQGVIQYLTAVTKAAAADVGFVILIDRRQDRWSSVHFTLQSVASCFPGDLRMIFVLRPTNIFHSALSGIAMRWQKEEFNNKVPIELLSSVDVLSPWIPKDNLPEELGGNHQYNHPQWIARREFIEHLADNVKSIIDQCKSNSLELINCQFPKDENFTDIGEEQDEKCKYFLEEIDLLIQNGENIMKNDVWDSDESMVDVVNTNKMDIEHLCSLILEVKDVFSEFWKKFVAKRTEYLSLRSFEKDYKVASMQLSSLIENLEEAMNENDMVTWAESQFLSIGNANQKDLEMCFRTCSTGEYLIDEHPHVIDCIKPKCEELKRLSGCFQHLMTEKRMKEQSIIQIRKDIQEVNVWCSNGMTLLAKQDLLDNDGLSDGIKFALQQIDSFTSSKQALEIYAKREYFKDGRNQDKFSSFSNLVNEAASNVDNVLALFEKRKTSLSQCIENHLSSCKVQVTACKDVLYELKEPENLLQLNITQPLTANDSASRENTAIVHPILHCDISPVNDDQHKLRHVIKELLETEKKYVEELNEIVEGYGHAIDDPSMSSFVPDELKNNKNVLLGNLEEILEFHRNNLLPEIEQYKENINALSNLFVERKNDFMLYCKYCHNSDRSKLFRKEIGENHRFFEECQRRLSHRLPLSAYLLKPVQRITKYQLLLQQLQKYCKQPMTEAVDEAVKTMMDVLKELNDSMHQISIRGFKEDFSLLGRLLLQGSFQVLVEHKKSKMSELARSKFNKPLIRHLFLYENALLICKKCHVAEGSDGEKEVKKNGASKHTDRDNTYLFKKCFKMVNISLTEVVKACPGKFKLASRGEDGELIVSSTSASIKQNWVKTLNNCISQHSTSRNHAKNSQSESMKKPTAEGERKGRRRSDMTASPHRSPIVRRSEKPTKQKLKKNPSKTKLSKNESTDEVNFGNIHGVDASPSKFSSAISVQEELCRHISDTQQQKSFRTKKKSKSTK